MKNNVTDSGSSDLEGAATRTTRWAGLMPAPSFRYIIILGLLSVALALAATVAGLAGVWVAPTNLQTVIRWGVEVFCMISFGLGAMVFIDAGGRYREFREKADGELLRETEDIQRERANVNAERTKLSRDQASLQAVSRYLHVTARNDELRVKPSGDAELDWSFRVSNVEPRNDFDLKIYSEQSSAGSASASSTVQVTRMEVAGTSENHPEQYYRWMETRHPVLGGNPTEFGVVKVPLSGAPPHLKEIQVDVGVEFRGTFLMAAKGGDYFVIEIPQLTDRISVKLSPSDPAKYRVKLPAWGGGSAIVAKMGYQGPEDPDETLARKTEVKTDGPSVIWEGTYPKLGYQYELRFELEKKT